MRWSRVYTHGTGELQFAKDKIFEDRVPDRMVVGMLHPNSYNGNYVYHPYAFQKFQLSSMWQIINGEEYPYRFLELTHNSAAKDMAGYHCFVGAAGFCNKGEVCMLTPEVWEQGRKCKLFVFDNTADGNANGPMLNPKQKGDLRLPSYCPLLGRIWKPIKDRAWGSNPLRHSQLRKIKAKKNKAK